MELFLGLICTNCDCQAVHGGEAVTEKCGIKDLIPGQTYYISVVKASSANGWNLRVNAVVETEINHYKQQVTIEPAKV
jgi:hypothetical protein